MEDSLNWQQKPDCPGHYYHPLPKEERIEPFRKLLHDSVGEGEKVT